MGLQRSYRYGVHVGYSDAITELGAVPLHLSSAAIASLVGGPDAIDQYIDRVVEGLDAVIISGGWDVAPAMYGEEASEWVEETEPARDILESSLIRAAIRQNKRLLAICRGIQILNVTLGGTLYQDLPSSGFNNHSDTAKEYEPSHDLKFEPDSLVYRLTEGATAVNTLHHQAIKDLAPSLKLTAVAPDGVIEAVEGENIIGVQWHPERLWKSDRRHLGTFAWLVGD